MKAEEIHGSENWELSTILQEKVTAVYMRNQVTKRQVKLWKLTIN